MWIGCEHGVDRVCGRVPRPGPLFSLNSAFSSSTHPYFFNWSVTPTKAYDGAKRKFDNSVEGAFFNTAIQVGSYTLAL